jgi:hypothetical protein
VTNEDIQIIIYAVGALILLILGWIKADLGRIEHKIDQHIADTNPHQ